MSKRPAGHRLVPSPRLLAIPVLIVCSILGDPTRSTRAEIVERVIAAIDGEPVTFYDLGKWARERGVDEPPSREMLEAYIAEQLVAREAKAQDIQVSDEAVDLYIDRLKVQRGMTDAEFDRTLREQGMDTEKYRDEVRLEIEKSELINKQVRNRVSVSPEEIRRQYDEHMNEYTMAERVKLRMILIPVPADASPETLARAEMFVQGLYFELQQGGDFAELARRYSAGPGAAEGGELGWFERGQMVDTLEKVAFRLPAGSIGMPIRSPAGYQLLKVEDREGSIQLPFDAVADEIRQQLYLRETEERYDDWLRNGLRKGHHVEVLW